MPEILGSRNSGGRINAVIEKIIPDYASEIVEILILIAKHEVHHALSSKARNCPEKAGLAQMDLIALAIMGRAIAPASAKSAKLKSIPLNARTVATNVAQNVANRFSLDHSCDRHWHPPHVSMYAIVYPSFHL